MDIKRLEQIITEDKLSKHNLFFKLKSVLPQDMLDTLIDVIKPCHSRRHITESLEETTINLVVVIMSIESTDLLTCVASKLANRIDLPRIEAVAASAALVAEVARHTDYLSLSKRGDHIIIKSHLNMSPRVQDILIEGECLPPMIVRPKPIKNNFSSGHLTINKDLLLSKHTAHNYKQNLFYINNVNNISLSLNKYILQYLEEPKSTLKSTKDKVAYDFHIAASNKAYEYILAHDNEFFLTHNYCTRGRTYCDNWMINYQGTDYKKSCVHLTKQELITC